MISEVGVLTIREVKKWVREPILVFMMIIQPVIWLGLFGKAFNLTGFISIPPELLNQLPPNVTAQIAEIFNQMIGNIFGGTIDYFTYMAAGMLSVIILFTSMFSGMSVVWDRRFGFLNKLLVAPIARGSIVMAKVTSSVIRGIFQAALVFSIAFAFGLKVGDAFNVFDLLGIFAGLFLLSLGLSSLFIALTIRIKSWEAHMAVVNLLNLPLMFASSALFPINQMPDWLQSVARFNPISYSSDLFRTFILHSHSIGLDISRMVLNFEVLIGFAIIFSFIGIILAERGLRKG
ncbi:MAG: ABC transporter permease [archaeon]|nr:ABC transporter permease [archaeon]MCP8313555.1 ABC transporter permease [archaeon]